MDWREGTITLKYTMGEEADVGGNVLDKIHCGDLLEVIAAMPRGRLCGLLALVEKSSYLFTDLCYVWYCDRCCHLVNAVRCFAEYDRTWND